MNDVFIAHHGVLGMKWGIRRYQPYPDGKKGRFVGKVKEVVKSEGFKKAAKTVAVVSIAAAGTAFVMSPQGQALLNTAISEASKMIADVKASINTKINDAVVNWNAKMDETFGEDFHRTDSTLASLNKKLEQEERYLAQQNEATAKTISEDLSLGDKAVRKVAETVKDPSNQEAVVDSAKSAAEKYLSDKDVSQEDVEKGLAIVEELVKKSKG